MTSYKFQIEPGEQERILAILSQTNDVIIDDVLTDEIAFTIELDGEEGIALYDRLAEEAKARVFSHRE
jgi:hypothetical protein